MKKQAVLTSLVRRIHCYFILILVPLSASGSSNPGKTVSVPRNLASRFGVYRLPGVTNERTFLSQANGPSQGQAQREILFPEPFVDQAEIAVGKSQGLPQRSLRSKSLVDRMPMSFGKKSTSGPDFRPPTANKAAPCQTLDYSGRCLELMQYGDPPEVQYVSRDLENNPNQEEKSMLRTTRGRLERMPLTYGKRVAEMDDPTADSISDSTYNSDLFTVAARHKLERMPNFFGKRNQRLPQKPVDSSPPGSGIEYDLNSSPGAKNTYLLMKDSIAKSETLDQSKPRGYEIKESKRSSRMDRMPLTYGKRQDQDIPMGHYFGPLYTRLGLPHLLYPENMRQHFDAAYRSIKRADSRFSKSALSSIPSNTGDTPDQHITEQVNPLILKMLNTAPFHDYRDAPVPGELAGPTHQQESLKGPNVYNIKRIRTGGLKRGKSGVVYVDIPFLMRQLREQKSKMHPEEYNRFKAQAQSVLDRYLMVDTPLTRSSRSRLGRMPLTYGKRSVNVKDRRSSKEGLSENTQSIIIPALSRRSRMDRMPLSFGKREYPGNQKASSGNLDAFGTLHLYGGDGLKMSSRLNDLSKTGWARLSNTVMSDKQQRPPHDEIHPGPLSSASSTGVNDEGDDNMEDMVVNSSTSSLSDPSFIN